MRILGAALLLAGVVACGSDTRRELSVFAASSLTEPFGELGRRLESSDPEVKVTFNFAASSALVTQMKQGADADVFAPADESQMQKIADAVETPTTFARNRLAIVVAKDNPKRVRGLADLARPDLVVVLCGAQVPCGTLADRALAAAKVTVKAASREENVKAVLTKVRLGEADAGIVYVTDVRAGGDAVRAIEIPDALAVYPIAAMKAAKNPADARAFLRLVTSPDGAAILAKHGFLPPA